jgi:4-alpha-glucanotransferase
MPTRSAGILIPLFSIQTRATFGRGEISDLASMIDFALAMGHRAIQLLPLDETAPGELSPYSALCVQAIDPMYIAVRELGGVGRVMLSRARTNIGNGRKLQTVVARREKLALLERAYRATRARGGRNEGPELDAFIKANAEWIHDYALFRALKDRFEWAKWEAWPAELMKREPEALKKVREELADKVEMYSYWQFIAHRQWSEMRTYASSRGVALGGDLAFSPGRDSAEVWANQADFDLTRSVGAPPDGFNAKGQRWGLPLPNWTRMRADGYRILRSRMRRAAAMFDQIRIDHVVGLYRTFNFGADENQPGAFTPADEPQQKIQGEDIISAIKQEAGGATIIAEDLGTVPPWVRQSLTTLGVAGYKVMQWERVNWDSPAETYLNPVKYPELSLATTGTHDTEALTTWWREQTVGEREKLVRALGIEAQANPHEMLNRRARDAILGVLYQAPSRLVLTPFQDLFGWSAQINRPGQVGDSNWTYRLPLPIEKLRRSKAIVVQVAIAREIAVKSGRFGE